MKKFILSAVLTVMICGISMANYTGQLGATMTSNDIEILNTTLTASNTAYAVTLSAGGTASYTIVAVGGDVNMTLSDSTSSTYITIPAGSSLWDHLPIKFNVNKTLWFWSTTAGAKVQILYSYY